jgi:hypothetical protein
LVLDVDKEAGILAPEARLDHQVDVVFFTACHVGEGLLVKEFDEVRVEVYRDILREQPDELQKLTFPVIP